MKTIALHSLLLVTLSSVIYQPLEAGEQPAPMVIPETAPNSQGDWEISLTPYLWMAGVEGVTGVGAAVAPVDMSFGDVLENLDLAFIIGGEVRKGRWGVLTNLIWMKLSGDENGSGILFDSVDMEMTQTILDVRIAYRLFEGQTDVDILAGARHMAVESDIDFKGGTLNKTNINLDEDWIDPMIGVRVTHQFNEKWSGILRADVGGFGASSELVWDVFGGFGYQATESIVFFAGYRHLDVDYNRGFTFDVEMSGPVLGGKVTF